MNIQTAAGFNIPRLPDGARCELTGNNPMFMEGCPLQWDACIPDLCEHYIESQGELYWFKTINAIKTAMYCVPDLCDDYTEDWGEEE